MLKEGDQSGGDAHNLVGGNIHIIDLFVVVDRELVIVTAGIAAQEFVVFIQRSVCLSDDIFIFSVGGEIDVIFGHVRAHEHVLNA